MWALGVVWWWAVVGALVEALVAAGSAGLRSCVHGRRLCESVPRCGAALAALRNNCGDLGSVCQPHSIHACHAAILEIHNSDAFRVLLFALASPQAAAATTATTTLPIRKIQEYSLYGWIHSFALFPCSVGNSTWS